MKTTLPDIRLGKILLHEIEPSDYLELYEIGRDEEMCKTLNWGPYLSPKEALFTIANIFYKRPDEGLPIGYGIYLKGRLIGMIDFHTYYSSTNACEIGYFLKRELWGQGIMQKCLRACIRLGFEYLDLDKLICGHTISNIRSKNTILRAGFRYEEQRLIEARDGMEIGYYYSIYKKDYEGGNLA